MSVIHDNRMRMVVDLLRNTGNDELATYVKSYYVQAEQRARLLREIAEIVPSPYPTPDPRQGRRIHTEYTPPYNPLVNPAIHRDR